MLQHNFHIRKEGVSGPVNLKMRNDAMIAWNGRLIFEVYMPTIPDRCGIKAYLILESKSGSHVVWMCILANNKHENIGLEVICAKLLNKGYHLYSTRTIIIIVLN